jgi:hypothetical protein
MAIDGPSIKIERGPPDMIAQSIKTKATTIPIMVEISKNATSFWIKKGLKTWLSGEKASLLSFCSIHDKIVRIIRLCCIKLKYAIYIPEYF